MAEEKTVKGSHKKAPEGDGYQIEKEVGYVRNNKGLLIPCQRYHSPLPGKPDVWVQWPEVIINKDGSWKIV